MPIALIRRNGAWIPLSVQGNSGLFVVGAVEPAPGTNTGPNGIWAVDKKAVNLLTPMYGDQIFNTPGQTIVNRDIFGFVTITAANVTLSGCKVRGYVAGTLPGGAHTSPATTSTGLINTNNANCSNAIIQDCELIPDNPAQQIDGIFARRYRAYRNNIQRCVDGFGAFDTSSANNADVIVYGNFVDKHAWFYPDAGHTNGSHCDGIQPQGGKNIDIQGNRHTGMVDPTIPGFSSTNYFAQRGNHGGLYLANSAIQFNTNTGALSNVTVAKNWFGGGDFSTVNDPPGQPIAFVKFDDNIFDGNNGGGNSWAWSVATGSTFSAHAPTGNKFSNGTLVTPHYQ
jgi:hypothetical protein